MTASADGDELLSIPLSALEHVGYCERQAALIHVEATWAENIHTVRGELAHRNVDIPTTRRRKGLTIVRSLPVQSLRHGLHGVCDLVEIENDVAVPVEYKLGVYRPGRAADLQLAGQAICLAETGYDVPVGYIYSSTDRRRHEVEITEDLIDLARTAADRMRAILATERMPAAHHDRRCRGCSLRDDCLPELTHTEFRSRDLFTARPLGAWRD